MKRASREKGWALERGTVHIIGRPGVSGVPGNAPPGPCPLLPFRILQIRFRPPTLHRRSGGPGGLFSRGVHPSLDGFPLRTTRGRKEVPAPALPSLRSVRGLVCVTRPTRYPLEKGRRVTRDETFAAREPARPIGTAGCRNLSPGASLSPEVGGGTTAVACGRTPPDTEFTCS